MSSEQLNINHKLMKRLGTAGLVPLALCTFYAWIRNPAQPTMLFIGFSAVVLAFVVGSLWGQALTIDSKDRELRPLLFVTAMVSLTAWTALILAFTGAPMWAIIALFAGFMLSYALENQFIAETQPSWYRQLRLMLTGGVGILHALMIMRFWI